MDQENVFKFVSVRPPQTAKKETLKKEFASYDKNVEQGPLLQKLREVEGMTPRKKIAEDFVRSGKYIYEAQEASYAIDLAQKVIDVSRQLGTHEDISCDKIIELISSIFDKDILAFIDSPEFSQIKSSAWDSYFAKTILFNHDPGERDGILAVIRLWSYLSILGDASVSDEEKCVIFSKLDTIRPIFPKGVLDDGKVSASAVPRQEKDNRVETQRRAIQAELKSLNNTLSEVKKNFNKKIIAAAKTAPRSASTKSTLENPGIENLEFNVRSSVAPWQFSESELTKSTKASLLKNDILFVNDNAPDMINKLERKIAVKNLDLERLSNPEMPKMVFYNNMIVESADSYTASYSGLFKAAAVKPALSGARPIGIGDLLVVRQKLLRYEAGEVAHIENVMQSEHKERKHRRLNRQEEILYVETENQKESERDLQSTERFEMQKETSKTIETDVKFEAGVKVNYYGPVNVEAHADFAYQNAQSESNKNSSKFAKDVTERSVSKILERTKQERTKKTFEEIEEINTHGFDNQGGDEHITGIYRWVDKVYEAQVFNYGRRLMYEFIVPEPGVFYLHAQVYKQNSKLATLKLPPDKPSLTPADIDRTNYLSYVAQLEVKDAFPPPQAGLIISETVNIDTVNDDNKPLVKVKEIAIPAGYIARKVIAWSNNYFGIVDGRFYDHKVGALDAGNMSYSHNVVSKIPLSIFTNQKSGITAVHIYCELIQEEYEKWKMDTYNKIMNAYNKAVMDYENKVAAIQIQQGVQISGENPLKNRETEKNELKKQCLSILTGSRLDYAGSVFDDWGQYSFGEAAAEGRITQFFEQAFEWHNITYTFYPYFWGRKSKWLEKMAIDAPDPIFNQFLKSGAARVLVPVHPAYNEAVLYFQQTAGLTLENRIWNGGDAPTIDDPLYISIVDEVKAASGLDENALPVGNPWIVKLPTTLVWLQKDSALPNFEEEE